jgi:hypothetical protein
MKAKSLAPKPPPFKIDPDRIDLLIAALGSMSATLGHLRDAVDTSSSLYTKDIRTGKPPRMDTKMVNALCVDGATDLIFIANALTQIYTWSADDAEAVRRHEERGMAFAGLVEKIAMEREILLRKIKHQVK